MTDGAAPLRLATGEMARLLGVSEAALRSLARVGVVDRAARGRFDAPATVQRFLQHCRAERAKTVPTPAADRLHAARLREVEMRVAQRERRLLPLDDATDGATEALGSFLTSITSLPGRLSWRDQVRREKLEAIVDAERARLAERFQRHAEVAAGGAP